MRGYSEDDREYYGEDVEGGLETDGWFRCWGETNGSLALEHFQSPDEHAPFFTKDNHCDPATAFVPSESSMMTTLTSAGGFAGAPLPVPSRTFLRNLEKLNNQVKHFTGDGVGDCPWD